MQPMFIAGVMVVVAGLEWWRYFAELKPNPIFFTFIAVALCIYAVWCVWRVIPKLRTLKQGIDGEKVVGQFLERLRETGYHVFHDLVGDGFNVDHVLIGPSGVYTVETKTWSKPKSGDARVTYDGERIFVAGREPERNPVIQTRAQAGWVKGLLTESTGRTFDVVPVVLFPGWYVEQSKESRGNLWLLEPKALPSLEHEPVRLSQM